MKQQSDVNYATDSAIYFYTPRYYPLDNFSAFSVTIWGHTFPTVEHAYQWKKYADTSPAVAQKIMDATNPHQVKKISDAHKEDCLPEWHSNKDSVMEDILRAKLRQHEKMQSLLLETGSKELFENSPIDSYWGVGPDGTGENQMGKLWMKLRAEL